MSGAVGKCMRGGYRRIDRFGSDGFPRKAEGGDGGQRQKNKAAQNGHEVTFASVDGLFALEASIRFLEGQLGIFIPVGETERLRHPAA